MTVIILAYNERKHLARAIESVKSFATRVVVVDSHSSDDTVDIAVRSGAEVLQRRWEQNYARQFNWGLDQVNASTGWVMRLDADEYVTPELAREIVERLGSLAEDTTGIYVKRRIHFLGRWIRHGRVYPMWVLRLWRAGAGRCENRWMDEHIVLDRGDSIRFRNDIVDDNLNDLAWWTDKHVRYATREAADVLGRKYASTRDLAEGSFGGVEQARIRRWVKTRVYAHLPLFLRPFLFFVYRYVVRLGFLDGYQGLIWHVLQGFWYRFLVDARVFEAERRARGRSEAIVEIVERDWGLK